MGFNFTERQLQVLNARGHNVIVSAAAGSGKTAVLVERIVRMITEPRTGENGEALPPLDIDRLLVVTFTRAAAAQMRERIGQAIAARLLDDPDNRHLQRQETLLHHAQITTIDSFCSTLLRNNIADIDLDPSSRVMDENEARLLRADIWEQFLQKCYQTADPAFMAYTDTWCKGSDDADIGKMVRRLVNASESHPDPIRWLQARRADYDIETVDDMLATPWMTGMMIQTLEQLRGIDQMLEAGIALTERPDAPSSYGVTLADDRATLFAAYGAVAPMTYLASDLAALTGETPLDPADRRAIYDRMRQVLLTTFGKLRSPGKGEKDMIDPVLQKRIKDLRDGIKDRIKARAAILANQSPEAQLYLMQQASETMHVVADLAIGYTEAYRAAKKDRAVMDYGDLERYALEILLETVEDESGVHYVPRRAAMAYRAYYDEVLIDEYQDSNEVQELLLSTISGEADGRYARFMVGDVKQSIYRFRNARPEIFVDKLDRYGEHDPETERIDLDQNFRSRAEVLDATNDVFMAIMRREIGGVVYDERVSLKVGATYPEAGETSAEVRAMFGEDPYRARLLLVHNDPADADDAEVARTDAGDQVDGDGEATSALDAIAELPDRKKEALAVAQEIRRMVGVYQVKDEHTHELRPARYRDMVILMRSGEAWIEAFRDICDKEGIPLYVDYKSGYFAAEEIRQVMQLLRVIDNPMQDIPLYGVLRGYFSRGHFDRSFSEDEIGQIRAASPEDDLYTAVCNYKGDRGIERHLEWFLDWLGTRRGEAAVTPVHTFVQELITDGYEDYVAALPAGAQRLANLRQLVVKAAAFEESQYAGLFEFVRYIDAMRQYEVDSGEANTLDENADVVRLMTIHKSKGLEFPIVFVTGLAGGFNFKRMDASGSLITDPDLGVGLEYTDPERRIRVSTLRKDAVADRIRRASLGEELRILYVAMTRAKERLVLTGFVKDLDRYMSRIETARAGILPSADPHLPAPVIQSAGSYLDLVMLAVNAHTRMDVVDVALSDMELREAEGEASMTLRRQTLEIMAGRAAGELPVPALAAELEERLSYVYPHGELDGLYTKCSVSDIKHREMESLGVGDFDESYDGGLDTADMGAVQMFSGNPDAPLRDRDGRVNMAASEEDIPRFIRGEEERPMSATVRGTAIHRAMELIDYENWSSPAAVTGEAFTAWVEDITAAGLVPARYAEVLTTQTFLPFLHDAVATRMAAAAASGTLRREQPFVISVPADTIDPELPATETVLVQGIIDAFWIEDGQIVILDYKTDNVRDSNILIDRYQVQLDYYANALQRTLHLPVKEKIIYSVKLQKTITV